MAPPIVILAALVATATAQSWLTPPRMSVLDPNGLRMAIDHVEGHALFAVHYSINKPLPGVAAGDWNVDIRERTGNEWVHENREVELKPGDVVNYWFLVMHQGAGHQLLDQSWTVPSSTPPATTRPAASTTPPATAPPSSTNPPPTAPPGSTNPPATPGGTTKKPGDGCDDYPCLIFNDEFNTLNFETWEHELTAGGGGNWEFQYYTNNRSNSYVRDGVLYLKPTLTEDKYGPNFLRSGRLSLWGASPANLCTGNAFWGCERVGTDTNYINPITSARLRSQRSLNIRYGKVEIDAQIPRGDWIWPALWMLPKWNEYGDWPASGEIDIMEARGNANLKDANGVSKGVDEFGSTMHWGPFFGENKYDLTMTTRHAKSGDFASAFHKYAVEWDETQIRFLLDGEEILKVDPGAEGFWKFGGLDKKYSDASNPWLTGTKMAPFDRPFHIIMNVAVGGTNGFFSDSLRNSPYAKPWNNKSPTAPREFWNAKNQWYPTWNPESNNGEDAAMKINYVKVWKMKPDPK